MWERYPSLQPRFLHRLLILGFEFPIQSNVLVDGKRLSATVTSDELEFCINQA